MRLDRDFLRIYLRNLVIFTSIIASIAVLAVAAINLIPLIERGGAPAYILLIGFGYLFFLLLPTVADWRRRTTSSDSED